MMVLLHELQRSLLLHLLLLAESTHAAPPCMLSSRSGLGTFAMGFREGFPVRLGRRLLALLPGLMVMHQARSMWEFTQIEDPKIDPPK